MSLSTTLVALLAALGLLLALLLPVHVAAFFAWRRGPAFPRKWIFILICTLLSYGVAFLVMVAFTPFQFVALQLAPQWGAAGSTLPSKWLGPVAGAGDVVA